jgi:3-methyladenine DNA glycosylase AlkD
VPGAENIYGVRMPVINELAKNYKSGGLELARRLWNSGAYEERMLAAKIIGKSARKNPARAIEMVKDIAGDIDNWAICDTIGMQSLKPLNDKHKDEIFGLSRSLIRSNNFWKRRLALVLVESFTRHGEQRHEIDNILGMLEGEKEYYVQKAIAWLNRNFKKRH